MSDCLGFTPVVSQDAQAAPTKRRGLREAGELCIITAMEISYQLTGITEALNEFSSKVVIKAINRSLNEIVKQSKTTASSSIRKIYNIKKARIDEWLKTKTISIDGAGSTSLTVKGPRPGLQNFGARETRKGVSVLVKKTSGRKIVGDAFIAKGSDFSSDGGAQGTTDLVFKRTGEAKRLMTKGWYAGKKIKREPIKKLNMTDAVGMMNVIGTKSVEDLMDKKFRGIFERNLKWYSKK